MLRVFTAFSGYDSQCMELDQGGIKYDLVGWSEIDKACEWLKNNWREYVNQDRDGMILFGHWESDFRKAMEE